MTEEPPRGVRRDAIGVHGLHRLEDGKTVRVVVTEQQLGPGSEPTLHDLSDALTAVYGSDFGIQTPHLSRGAPSGRWPRALLHDGSDRASARRRAHQCARRRAVGAGGHGRASQTPRRAHLRARSSLRPRRGTSPAREAHARSGPRERERSRPRLRAVARGAAAAAQPRPVRHDRHHAMGPSRPADRRDLRGALGASRARRGQRSRRRAGSSGGLRRLGRRRDRHRFDRRARRLVRAASGG